MSLTELRTRPKPSYTIDRLLQADSVAVLEGVDGTYKSFLALAWAHCVALGRPWLGRPVQQGRVLYLLGEGSRGLPKRADAWQIANLKGRQDLDTVLGFVVDEMPQLWKGDASEVLAANPGPFTLVVVDTLARSLIGGNENLQQDMGQFVAGCEDLRRGTCGATVLILHHLNLAGGTRGSTSLPGAISTRLRLERKGESRVVTLHTKKQRDDEPEPAMTLIARTVELGTLDEQRRSETSLVLDLGDAPDVADEPEPQRRLMPASVRALEALAKLGSASYADWWRATAQAKSTFQHAREQLSQEGYVDQPEAGGPWHPTAKGIKGPEGPKQGPLDLLDPAIDVGPENGSGRGSYMDPPDPPDPQAENRRADDPEGPDPRESLPW